jgi:hypothetical protein
MLSSVSRASRRSVAGWIRSTVLSERTPANGRERLHQIDKLGVTSSSPAPPIGEGPGNGAFLFPEART